MLQTMKSLNLLQKWYVKNSLTAKDKNNENSSNKLQTKTINLFLSYYSDAFILVTGDTNNLQQHNNNTNNFR